MRALPAVAVLAVLGSALASLAATPADDEAGAGGEPAAVMTLRGAEATLGCGEVRGVYVAVLAPGRGVVLLSTRPLPEGRRVGSLEGRRLRVELAGGIDWDVPADDAVPSPAPVWGVLDRSLEIGGRRGCVGFGDRRFTSRDDLLTFVHWLLRDVFFQLPADVRETTSSLSLLGRHVSLEVAPPDQRPVLLEGREGATLGFRLAGSERLHLLQAFILDRPAGRLWVRLSAKDGPYFGPGTPAPWTGVEVLPGAPSVAPTTPPIAVRLVRIGD